MTHPTRAPGDDQDMDRKFLQDLRELKPVLGAHDVMDELSQHCIRALLQQKLDTSGANAIKVKNFTEVALAARHESSERIRTIFFKVVPSLFQIGAGLSHSRELRDIFEDVVDTVVIPCKGAECTITDVKLFFSALQVGYSQLTTVSRDTREQYALVVKRFLAGLSVVTVILYNE